MTNLNDEFPLKGLNLILLAEECAEVIQVTTKIARFGLDDVHPVHGETNRDMLSREVGDLLAILTILSDNGVLDDEKVDSAVAAKLDNLPKYYPEVNA